jgi:pyruvate dehydrogenase E1 component alpha subunit
VADRAVGYDIPGVSVDATDVMLVHEAAAEAIDRARRGEGPSLLEARAPRLAGHYEGDTQTYRRLGEDEQLAQGDPLLLLRHRIESLNPEAAAQLDAVRSSAEAEVDAAWTSASRAAMPEPETALEDVYASDGAQR